MKVYLCGPINGCTDAECNDWRSFVKSRLPDTIDPMRRDYRGREADCVNEIVELDKVDVEACDVLIANCPKPSVGTSMEVFLAWQLGKKIAVIAPDPVSPWLKYHSTQVFATIGEAVTWIESLSVADPIQLYSYAESANAERWHGQFDSIPAAIAEALGEYGSEPDRVVYIGENEPFELDHDSLAEDVIERISEQAYEEVGEVADSIGPFNKQERKPLADAIKAWADKNADINCWTVENIKAYKPGDAEYEQARALLATNKEIA